MKRCRHETSSKYGAVIILPDGSEFGFRFGVNKARLILEHLSEIRAWVDSIDGRQAPRQPDNSQPIEQPASVPKPAVILSTAQWQARGIPTTNGNGWHKPAVEQPAPRKLAPLPMTADREDRLQDTAREESTCRGCGKTKEQPGLLVCWDCMKRHPVAPLLNWMGAEGKSFTDWLSLHGKNGGAL